MADGLRALLPPRCVGLAFSRIRGKASRGRRRHAGGDDTILAAPTPVITHVLDGMRAGRYQGFPQLGIRYRTMDAPSLRKWWVTAADLQR